MYYKVIGNGTVLNVLKSPQYVTYQERNKLIVLCERSGARGVLSTDGSTVWHVSGWGDIPLADVATVQLVEILEDEYEILKNAIGSEPRSNEEIRDSKTHEPPPSEVTLSFVKEKKIQRMKEQCESNIVNGVDVIFSDGLSHHFDLTIEDQINLISLKEMIVTGVQRIPYHESGCLCKMYDPQDIAILLEAASAQKTYQVTYFNSLKAYINSLKEVEAVENVYYGMIIPENFCSDVLLAITGEVR